MLYSCAGKLVRFHTVAPLRLWSSQHRLLEALLASSVAPLDLQRRNSTSTRHMLDGVTINDAPFLPLLPAKFGSQSVPPQLSIPVLLDGSRVELVACSLEDSVASLATAVSAITGGHPGSCSVIFLDDGALVPRALRIRDVLPHAWAVLSGDTVLGKFSPARSTRGVAAARTLPALALALGHGGAKGADESALLSDVRDRLRRIRDGHCDASLRASTNTGAVAAAERASQAGSSAHGGGSPSAATTAPATDGASPALQTGRGMEGIGPAGQASGRGSSAGGGAVGAGEAREAGRRGLRFPEFVQLVRECMASGGYTDAHLSSVGGGAAAEGGAGASGSELAGGLPSARGPRDARLRGSERGIIRVARALAAELERSGEVVRVRHSADRAVRDTLVLLREEDTAGMAAALDVRGERLRGEIEVRAAELAALLRRLEKMDSVGGSIMQQARRQARRSAAGLGALMVAQYALIFQQIYTVSWDVMEPLCYFLAQSYAVGAYAYYLSTRAEPDNASIFGWLVHRRRAAMHRQLPRAAWHSPAKFDADRSKLVLRIASLRDELAVSLARLGLAPESHDFGAAALAAPVAAAAVEAAAASNRS